MSIWRKPHLVYYWAPPILWSLAVLCMSGDLGSGNNTLGLIKWFLSWFVVPSPAQLKIINHYIRKTGHVLAYGGMYFFWFRALRKHLDYGLRRAFIWSLGFCLLFSSLDEGRQWFYSSRGSSVWDIVLDMSGSGLSALITAAVWRPRSGVRPQPEISGGQTSGPQ